MQTMSSSARLAGVLVLAAVGLRSAPAPAQGQTVTSPPNLDAVFRVEVTEKGVIQFRFDPRGTADESFESVEYRYAVLDKSGVQVDRQRADAALLHIGVASHTTLLPKDKPTVSDYSDYLITQGLQPGEEYYLVVSVRNLTGLAKFKAP